MKSVFAQLSRWNRVLKKWPSWVIMVFAVVALVAVGATRDGGPQSAGDRVDSISRRLACPVCDGESVFESRNNASDSIRSEITAQVSEGRLGDDQIIEFIAGRFGAQVLLVPRSTGIEALVWAIPAAALVVAMAGLAMAFRRWRDEALAYPNATQADFDLVAGALSDDALTDSGRSETGIGSGEGQIPTVEPYRSDEAGQE
jgi:cytochrome c-type biogenesis protein CcmH